MNSLITSLLKQEASALGFDACGVAPVEPLTKEGSYLLYWLSQKYHAGMDYLSRNTEIREDPSLLLNNAKSIVVLLINYRPPQVQAASVPQVAYYAYGNDYHQIIQEKLNDLLAFLQKYIPSAKGRCFVDTAPIMEKVWAVRAGLGWRGKNTLLITPTLGSYVFIGTIVVDAELVHHNAELKTYCGSCTRCIDACPTKALKAPYTIDANRCIAYHTIESKGELGVNTSGYLYGCDICQKVCPWNKKSVPHQHYDLAVLPEIMNYTAKDWLALEEEEFQNIFAKSPLKRVGLEKLKKTAAALEKGV